MKKAIVATMIATMLYAMYLWVLQNVNGPQVETTVTFFVSSWLQLPLNFSVSPWWNLMISLFVIMTLAYFFNQEAIIGKEPRGAASSSGYKYYTRQHVFLVNSISLFMAVAFMILAAFISPILEDELVLLGPLSALVDAVIIWFVCYIGFAIWIEALMCFVGWNTIADEMNQIEVTHLSLIDRYQVTMASFVKIGVIKTLPFTIGMTLGFLLRISYEKIISFLKEIISFLKPIKISYNKEANKI